MLLHELTELGILVNPVISEADVSHLEASAPLGACVSPVSLDRIEEQAVLATPLGAQVEPEAPPATLPRFEPFSPENRGSSTDAKLKVHLLRLQLEAQEKDQVRKADYDLRLQICRLEIEAEKGKKVKTA